MISKVERFQVNKKYRVKKDFTIDTDPIKYEAKKGELLVYLGKSLYARFEGADRRLILLSTKEAFRWLEEAE